MRLISATIAACQGAQPYDQVALVLDLRCSPEGDLTYISHALEPLLDHEDEKAISMLRSNDRVVVIKCTNGSSELDLSFTVGEDAANVSYQELVAAVIQKGVSVAECINNDIEFII